MTAEEALKLSPTGFIWTDGGTPAYMDGEDFHWSGGIYVLHRNYNWHPLPPSLRMQQNKTPSTKQYMQAHIDSLKAQIAELESELEAATPKLKRKPLSEPPDSLRNVLIFHLKECLGRAWYSRVHKSWCFNFSTSDDLRPCYTWTEMPEVE